MLETELLLLLCGLPAIVSFARRGYKIPSTSARVAKNSNKNERMVLVADRNDREYPPKRYQYSAVENDCSCFSTAGELQASACFLYAASSYRKYLLSVSRLHTFWTVNPSRKSRTGDGVQGQAQHEVVCGATSGNGIAFS